MAKRKQYIVEGTICDQKNKGIKGLLVRATDQDPKTPENLLGIPVYTNDKGKYKITYTDADFRIKGRESGGADIIIRVFSPEGLLLGKSKRHNNSPRQCTIDMKVDYAPSLPVQKELIVSGKVELQDGQEARGFFIRAFDKDLRSEQLLGEGLTNKNGNYTITYSSESLIRSERGSADIFIKVLDPKNRIVGTSDIVFNAPSKASIDIRIKAEGIHPLSEFELLHLSLSPLLSGIELNKLDESDKHKDISFLSGETGYSRNQIKHFVQAYCFELDSKITASFWYAVLSFSFYRNLSTSNLEEERLQINRKLSQLDEQGIRKALRVAFANNKIEAVSEKKIKKWLQSFNDYIADTELTPKDNFTRKALEEVGVKEVKKQAKFARAFNKHKTFSSELVADLKKDKFKVSEINDLQTTYELSGFANGDFEVVKSIKKKFKTREPKDIPLLAKRSEKEWTTLIEKTHNSKSIQTPFNLEILKGHEESFINVYGKSIKKQFATAFPTMAFSGALDRAIKAEDVSGLKNPEKLKRVIDNNPGFEFLTSPIDELAKKDSVLKNDEELKLELKSVQRVFKLTPDFEATNTLLKDDLHSAHGVYRMGETEFIRKYANEPGFTKEKAKTTWKKAEATHAASVTLIAELKAVESAGTIAALNTGNNAISDFPNWNNLFKGGDICECKHCRSAYSPAAYFADLLMFLKDRKPKGIPVKDLLFDRRPDLGYLELNCENANVTLPYIDVVNEVLEAVIANGENDKELAGFDTIDDSDLTQAKTDIIVALQSNGLDIGENIHLARIGSTDRWVIHSEAITYLLKKKGGANYFVETLRNTKRKADELRANPQYVNSSAYQKLSAAKFPFVLPFDLFSEEVEASFNKVKVKRWEIMQLFKGTVVPNSAADGEIAAVYFGISVPNEKDIILQSAPSNQFELWGENSNATLLSKIKNVKTFLRTTGLEYTELLSLLDLEFINPNGTIQIHHLDPTCDTSEKEIKPLDVDALDRVNRFLRLWKKLGWKMWEIDMVIRHDNIGNGSLNEPFLINLMYLIELKNKLGKKVSVEQVCSLFGNLNFTTRFTELHEKREDAIYQDLFLNSRLIIPIDKAFEITEVNAGSNTEKIASHLSIVQAALRLKETDLNTYLNLSKASDGTLYIPNGVDGDLILTHLSFLYRHSLLTKSLNIKSSDWETFLKLYNTDLEIFTDPRSACEFVDDIKLIQSSEFGMDDLNYLLTANLESKSAAKENTVGAFLLSLRESLQAISNEFETDQYDFLNTVPLHDVENLEELLTGLLLKNNLNQSSIDRIFAILNNNTVNTIPVQNIPVNFEFPEIITANPIDVPGAQDIKINYIEDGLNSKFVLTGLLTTAKKNTLLNHASLTTVTANLDYQAALQELFELSIDDLLHLRFFNTKFEATLENTTVDFENNLPKETASKIKFNAAEKKLELNGVLSRAEKSLLDNLDPDPAYLTAVQNIYLQLGMGASDELWISPDDLDISSDNFYSKNLALAIRGKSPNSNSLLNYFKEIETESTIIQQLSEQLSIAQNMAKKLINDYQLIGTESIFEYLKNTFSISFGVVDYAGFKETFDTYYWLHRVGLFIAKWGLNFDQLEWLTTYNSPTQTLDLTALPIDSTGTIASLEHFLRTEKLLNLNARFDDDETSILSIIGKLHNGKYTNVTDFSNELEILTEWSAVDVENWINHVDLNYHIDYLLVEKWMRLYESMKILKQLNSGTITAIAYSNPTMGQAESQTLKQLLRSKYGAETWLTISTEIQDVLRERKRNALAAYLLAQTQPADAPSGKWENTNDLYAYYLLDIEMSSCMLTSRLVQGSGSIQLFVQRCFMGLEPEVHVKADGDDGDSAWRWWKWMRKYRVWEANRKVFLYPENWIEPELRRDKSSFFQDLENELLQNEVNQLNVEQAYLNYLDKLNEVAHLDIAAFYHEDDADQTIVHVFGRTANADPHIYYYRQYDYRQWTPWEKIEVDITGDHLIPLVINKRLFLYWPEFREEPDNEKNRNVPIPDTNDDSTTLPSTYKRTQIRMATTELRNKKWLPKKVSNDYYETDPYYGNFSAKKMEFYVINKMDLDGKLGIKFTYSKLEGQNYIKNYDTFELFGCDGLPVKSAPKLNGTSTQVTLPFPKILNNLNYIEHGDSDWSDPESDFLLQENSVYSIYQYLYLFLKTPTLHKSYFAWQTSYLDRLLEDMEGLLGQFIDKRSLASSGSWLPFFYADRKKTFMAFPMIDGSKNGSIKDAILTQEGRTYYYPEIKEFFRELLKTIEGYIRSTIDAVDLTVLIDAQKVDFANTLARALGQDLITSISDDDLKEMMVLYYIKIFSAYLGAFSALLFNFRKYHFKNFYHPFICDFIKLVYNPTQGITALMSRETQMKNSGFDFGKKYDPTFRVFDHPAGKSYPEDIVDFSPDGSYSSYNWELFYHSPLMIANNLSTNQRFEEAMDWYHFIFNPIGVEGTLPNGSNAGSPQKYWITKPFFLTTDGDYNKQRIDTIMRMIAGDTSTDNFSSQLKADLEAQVKDWRHHPFEPHRIAQYRNVAYQKTVFMKYLDNLVAWGDHLFKQDSMESINEATQLYILAAELLGPRPKTIPPQVNPPIETFNELEEDFDDFSNALIQIENFIPVMPEDGSTSDPVAPIPTLYFCIPQNDKILGYWDTIADRLHKIRNCMNIEGVVRQLSLFEPEIDPGALVKAVAGGMDTSSALADLNAPLPYYRFNTLLLKANEVCNDVKTLGNALLSALEKKDAEELTLLRQGHEMQLLEAIHALRELQIDEAKKSLDGLKETKKLTEIKRNYYRDIEKVNSKEELQTKKLTKAHNYQEAAQGTTLAASIISLLPDIDLGASGFGGTPLAKFKIGGLNLGQSSKLAADILSFLALMSTNDATMASIKGGQDRRWDDWKFQESSAKQELVQIDEQIKAAELRIKIAKKELSNQELQIKNSNEVNDFMRSKYTNKELYQWMLGQISQVYFQSYQLAYDLAKRAERCYRFELGIQDSNFIKFGYWDSLKKGLLSGDKLQYDLRRLESSYLEENRRELELTKHISLALLDPLALIKLRETGKCFFNLPEEIFDLDYPGHYFRRIKSVSISLPCVAGPYTTISCSLRLLNNRIRIQTGLSDGYIHNNEEGVLVNDSRFTQNNIPIKAIATSNAQNDSGIFELNFRDERYLPFEGAGAISDWTIDLFNDPNDADFGKALRQFDYKTISDAIVHIRFTAREAGGLLKDGAIENLKEHYSKDDHVPSMKIIDLKHDFSSEWHKMTHPDDPVIGNVLEFKLHPNLFPFRDQIHIAKVNSITLIARCSYNADYDITFNPPLPSPPPPGADEMTLTPVSSYGNLHFATRDSSADSIQIDHSSDTIWNLKIASPSGNNLLENEIEDMYLVLGYEWND